MVRKPTPEVATGLELPGLENHEPQNPFVFINGFTCGVPPSSMESLCQTAARWQQRGVCAAAPEVSESQGRFPKPGKPQEPPPPRQAQLTLPGGAQASSSPWTLPIPKGKGQNPEPLLSVLIALPANGGEEGVSNDMPLDLCPGNILSLFFLFFKTISFYSSGWSQSLTMQPSLASHS